MYKVRLNVPVDICNSAGTRTQATLSKLVILPEPPRTDLVYLDKDLGRLTKLGTPAEILVGDYVYDLDAGMYIANCQRVVISRLEHTELRDEISWATDPAQEVGSSEPKSNLRIMA